MRPGHKYYNDLYAPLLRETNICAPLFWQPFTTGWPGRLVASTARDGPAAG